MRFTWTCACLASLSPRQCSPEYFLVLLQPCKSRVPTFRTRSGKLDEGRREVVGRVVFARRSSWLRLRCRLCCWPERDCSSEVSCGFNQSTPDLSRNRS